MGTPSISKKHQIVRRKYMLIIPKKNNFPNILVRVSVIRYEKESETEHIIKRVYLFITRQDLL